MKKIILALMLFATTAQAQLGFTSYTQSFADIPNPERGFCYQAPSWTTETAFTYNYQPIDPDEVAFCVANNITLVQRIIRLDNYRNTASIEPGFLSLVAADFGILRNAGLKCILRFAYSDDDSPVLTTNHYEPPQSVIHNHIVQLRNITLANEDVISSMEAGFIGKFGEWYYTTNFGNAENGPLSQSDLNLRTAVANDIMTMTTTRFVAFRTPQFQNYWHQALIRENSAFYNGSVYSRIAAHNDAFMHDILDQGTYSSATVTDPLGNVTYVDRNYLASKSKHTFTGGESNNFNFNFATCFNNYNTSVNTLGKNAIQQMEEYHYSYLNEYFHPLIMNDVITTDNPTLGHWVTTNYNANGNCRSEVKRRLGYRFVLKETELNGAQKKVIISMWNYGFANVFNKRKVYLVLKNGPLLYRVTLSGPTDGILAPGASTDPRVWNAGGTLFKLSTSLIGLVTAAASPTVPANTQVPNGTYNLFLEIPDETLTDPRYSIQCANLNVWDSNTGYNNLNKVVTIGPTGISKISNEVAFDVVTSPNPFGESFKLNISTSDQESVTVKVFDMLGKIVEDRTAQANEIENLEIGSKLSTGIYNVVVTQGDNEKTVRVVKN